MSQVEFVTVILTLFGQFRAEPVGPNGQGLEDSKEYFKELIEDFKIGLTLQINRPEEFKLRWLARAG
jgi:hypothetical protein